MLSPLPARGALLVTALALLSAATPAPRHVPEEFVTVPPMTVAIIDGAVMTGRIDLKLVLLAPRAEDGAALAATLPEIQGRLLGAASDFALWTGNPSAPLDVGELSRRLDAAVPHGTRVLVQQVSASRA